ncbi:Cofilin-1 [Manis pentadactyla]|nr:Cofilin-1 [Manis pentadactyla]
MLLPEAPVSPPLTQQMLRPSLNGHMSGDTFHNGKNCYQEFKNQTWALGYYSYIGDGFKSPLCGHVWLVRSAIMTKKDLKQLSFGLSTSEVNNLYKCKTTAVTVWFWHVRSDLKVLNCH